MPAVLQNNETATLTEGQSGLIIDSTLLQVVDPDNDAADLRYTLVNNVSEGILLLSGSPLSANDTFTQADVDAGRLTYDHGGGEAGSDTFEFSVEDAFGTAISTSESFLFNIAGVNESVTITPVALDATEGSTGNIISTGELNAVDPDDSGDQLTYTLLTDVNHGTLLLSGSRLSVNDVFTQQDIIDGNLTYDHDGGESVSDSFDFRLSDGLEDGAVAELETLEISIQSVNDAPVLNTGDYSLNNIVENQLDSSGNSVADILISGGGATDAESGTSLELPSWRLITPMVNGNTPLTTARVGYR